MSIKERGRRPVTQAEIDTVWAGRKAGESLLSMAKRLDRNTATIFRLLSLRGGIMPPARKRSEHHLSLQDRVAISSGLAAGASIRSIAASMGRAASSVSREIARNGGRGGYDAVAADEQALVRALRPKPCRLAGRPRLARLIARKLAVKWSPAQIAEWLKSSFPHDADMHLSHETIYRSLFIQARGVLKKELTAHLRKRRVIRHAKTSAEPAAPWNAIPDMVSIRERPAEAEDRAIPGHWEGDLIAGSNNSHIATLVERHSRFVILVKVDGKDTLSVISALTQAVQKLPEGMMVSLTWDQGREMAAHQAFTVATDVKVYFCDPRSPWQRGSNENTNGLLRQYFPKGEDLSTLRQTQLDYVSAEMNARPRKTLGFKTPGHTLAQALR
jgi:IS30 family transposase